MINLDAKERLKFSTLDCSANVSATAASCRSQKMGTFPGSPLLEIAKRMEVQAAAYRFVAEKLQDVEEQTIG